MQATMSIPAAAPLPRLQLARRGYMMRSEKRQRSAPQGSPEQGGRPPRRRRPRAGFFYKFVMVLLLLTVWPIGLIMLWRRRLHWSALTKLFTSVITLMACILLLGTALTADIPNPTIAAAQDSINDFLGTAADTLVDFSITLGERADRSLDALDDIAYYGRQSDSLVRAADAIDRGVELAREARARLSEFFANLSAAPEEEAPAPGDGVESEDSEAPTADEGGEISLPDAQGEAAEDEAPESAVAEITVNADAEELPVYLPASAPDAQDGAPVQGGMLLRSGELDAEALPTPTPEPEPEDLTFAVKPASEAIVYFNIGSGKYYHTTPVCGPMKNADAHTFAEVDANIHEPCERCNPPVRALLYEVQIVWMDESNVAHLTDECAAFTGQWTIKSAADAIEMGVSGCANCGADRYLKALADGNDVVVVDEAPDVVTKVPETPTPEPTPEPTLAPTPEPTPQIVTPRETLKPAANAIVYHSTNGKYYHMNDHCSGMTGGSLFTLSECVKDGYQQCANCGAPAPESMERLSLWKDEAEVCHVSDECEYFEGLYSLIDREEALDAGLVGCAHCGAADYLIPFTVLNAYVAED